MKNTEVQTEGFTETTHCVAFYDMNDPHSETYEIVGVVHSYGEAQELLAETEKANPDGYYRVGQWFKRAFWFDDENHTASCVVPIETAYKYMDKEDVEEELEYYNEWCDEDEKGNQIQLGLGQMWNHVSAFTDDGFTEEEILEFYGYDPEMLKEGAYFTGWCDG